MNAKQILLDELKEQSHPEKVEDVIFCFGALRSIRTKRNLGKDDCLCDKGKNIRI